MAERSMPHVDRPLSIDGRRMRPQLSRPFQHMPQLGAKHPGYRDKCDYPNRVDAFPKRAAR